MIVGGTSSTGRGLGDYLTEAKNERAEVWELQSGRRDLSKAVDDWKAHAHGTNTEKPLYHAWIRPSDTDRELSREEWRKAVELFERELGLEGQPRAVVYHHGEGQGEQGHIHLVYSRIKDGKALSDSWNYIRHEKARAEIERALNLEHVYSPHLDRNEPRRAQSFGHSEKEQGKRLNIDPKAIKAEVSAIYQSADSGRAFVAALDAAGYTLAQGDKRGLVILDQAGGVHSLSRMAGAKVAALRDRLADYPLEGLPTVEQAREQAAKRAAGIERGAEATEATPKPPRAGVVGWLRRAAREYRRRHGRSKEPVRRLWGE